jgi:hypothetical protein
MYSRVSVRDNDVYLYGRFAGRRDSFLVSTPLPSAIRQWARTFDRIGPSYCAERAFDLDMPASMLKASK